MSETKISAQAVKYTILQPSRYGWHVCMMNDIQTLSVLFQGEAGPNETEILCSMIKPGNVVIDAGASAGSFSLAFASAVGSQGKVFAIEPQTIPYQCLVANTVLNSLSHVIFPIQAAVGETNGEIDVPQLDPFSPDHGGCSMFEPSGAPKMPMPLMTIDTMNLSACHLIKIDVEGMEPRALKGAYNTIAKYQPILWVEYLDYRPDHAVLKPQLLEIFEEHDYDCWYVNTGLWQYGNTRRQTHNPFQQPKNPWPGDQNVLALPRGTNPPDLSKFQCVVTEFK